MQSAEEFGAALETARLEALVRLGAGANFKSLERYLWTELGPYAPSRQTIVNYHRGKVGPDHADLLAVSALARLYGKTLAEISPTLEERRDLLIRQSPYIGRVAA